MFTLLVRRADESIELTPIVRGAGGRLAAGQSRTLVQDELVEAIRQGEHESTRWVWDDTARWYPRLLSAGVFVERCVDLRLVHAILRASAFTRGSVIHASPRGPYDSPQAPAVDGSALFVVEPESLPDALAEFLAQRDAIEASPQRARLELLATAESTGALVAAEMRHAGIPWSAAKHDELLTAALGPRPPAGERPLRLLEALAEIREALGSPELNPDSPTDLIRALRAAGLQVASTRQWELKSLEHPVIEPLLRYKKMQRLLVANGWTWLDAWVRDGRFRPEYVPAAAATGRWGTSGGGALQLPRAVRGAVVADPGHALVVADASQLEPRILTALSEDTAMARAGSGDLYEGIVATGAVATRAEAKVAMLGAMYGATQGDGGRLMPRLTRAFPRAIALVEDAARVGEAGESSRPSSVAPRPLRAPAPRSSRPRWGVPTSIAACGPGVDSPATSWCRAPRPSGRSAGWASSVAPSPSATDAAPTPRTWCSSCTTRSWCTRRSLSRTMSHSSSSRPRRRPGASCSEPRRCGSRSRWRQ